MIRVDLENMGFPYDSDYFGRNEVVDYNNNNLSLGEKMDLSCDGEDENISQDIEFKSSNLYFNKSLLGNTDYCCDNFNMDHNTFDFYKSFKNNFEENSINSIQTTDDADNINQKVLFNNKEENNESSPNSSLIEVNGKEFLNKKRKQEKIFDIEKIPNENKTKKITSNH